MKQLIMPPSSLFTPAEATALEHAIRANGELCAMFNDDAPPTGATTAEVVIARQRQAKRFANTLAYRRLCELYPATVASSELAAVRTEVFSPTGGIASKNQRRLLINLHGGGFQVGWSVYSQLESAPIAVVSGIKVLSIDYRTAPAHRYPAATDDVITVYQALLKEYAPSSMGIYGCSAGALLTAQVTARLANEGLPLPGAIGMFCGAGTYWSEGDSGQISPFINQFAFLAAKDDPYFQGTDLEDPLAFPARTPKLLAKFPPSLLISATRDLALSSVVRTHSLLTQQGVNADLHVWEGLDHAFHYFPDLPQSREAYELICRFFDRHLGT